MNVATIIHDTIAQFRLPIIRLRQIARANRRLTEAARNIKHIVRLAEPR